MRNHLAHSILGIFVIAIAATAFSSCNNDNCFGNSTGIPLAGFYNDDDAVVVPNLTVYGIGAPNDSAIIRSTSTNQVYLPLSITKSTCHYVLDYNTEGTKNDTITFNYNAIPYFESHECGAMYNFMITSWEYTQHNIDSVTIKDPMITNADVVSIKIYMQ